MKNVKNQVRYIQQYNEFNHLVKCIESAPTGETFGILLIGPPGTGKTLCAMDLARHYNSNYIVVDGSPQTDRRDLEGCWEIVKGNTVFNKGPLYQVIEQANNEGIAFLVFNEPNAVNPSEQISFNALMTENHINLLSNAGKRIEIEPHAKLIVIGTINLNVLGINDLQEAFDDRFLVNWEFEYPAKKKEAEIIKKMAGCSKSLAELISELAYQLREAAMKDFSLKKPFSTRHGVNFAKMIWAMKRKYIRENIRTMIVSKIAKEKREKEFISQILDGLDFKKRLWDILK